MTDDLAILAGSGNLPLQIAAERPQALFVSFSDGTVPNGPNPRFRAHFEALGAMFEEFRAVGIKTLVMAGAMARPRIDSSRSDPTTQALLPRLSKAMSGGDDGLLREIISIFEEQGFDVVGANEILTDFTVQQGLVCGPAPSDTDLSDEKRARRILTALGPHDVGQAVVVAGGLCLGVETLQGTDALLKFVEQTPAHLRSAKGVLVKAPKTNQDLRVDMPTIGPVTVKNAIAAGLAGISVDAGAVLILDRQETFSLLESAGLFLLAE